CLGLTCQVDCRNEGSTGGWRAVVRDQHVLKAPHASAALRRNEHHGTGGLADDVRGCAAQQFRSLRPAMPAHDDQARVELVHSTEDFCGWHPGARLEWETVEDRRPVR